MAADFITLSEMVKRARTRLARGEWDYLMGAAETETSLKRNRLAFDHLALKARVLLHDVSKVHTRRTLLGFDQRIPVLLAPIGSVQVFEQGGGVSTARAAEKFGVIQILVRRAYPTSKPSRANATAPRSISFMHRATKRGRWAYSSAHKPPVTTRCVSRWIHRSTAAVSATC